MGVDEKKESAPSWLLKPSKVHSLSSGESWVELCWWEFTLQNSIPESESINKNSFVSCPWTNPQSTPDTSPYFHHVFHLIKPQVSNQTLDFCNNFYTRVLVQTCLSPFSSIRNDNDVDAFICSSIRATRKNEWLI